MQVFEGGRGETLLSTFSHQNEEGEARNLARFLAQGTCDKESTCKFLITRMCSLLFAISSRYLTLLLLILVYLHIVETIYIVQAETLVIIHVLILLLLMLGYLHIVEVVRIA
jgi:hypothetical protein